jgi:DegV family protein with EDD domain
MIKKIGIITDSTADFPEGMAEELEINIIPIHIFVDGNDYLHGVTISNQDVIERLNEDSDVKTAPPFPSEYSDFYTKLAGKYDLILSFHVSSDLSDCYKSAKNSMKILSDKTAEKITLIDTRNVSVGQALIIKKAAELKMKYNLPDLIKKYIEPFINNSMLLFTVENLYWLKRAGKLNFFSSLMGNFLNVKPVIGLKSGKLVPLGKHRGREPAVEEMIKLAREEYEKFGQPQDIWIAHADALDDAARIQETLMGISADMGSNIRVVEIGPTIAAHTGPGCLCLGMVNS